MGDPKLEFLIQESMLLVHKFDLCDDLATSAGCSSSRS